MVSPCLYTYNEFKAYFAKARSKELGRPLKGWCRLFKVGNDYVVRLKYGGSELFRVSPNNVLTFTLPKDEFNSHSQTLTNSLGRLVPLQTCRYRKGVYRVDSKQNLEKVMSEYSKAHLDSPHYNRWRVRWNHLEKKAPQYFNGMEWDLITGECLNPQPDMLKQVKPTTRTKWIRDLRRFKKGLKTRAKVGALQGYIKQDTELRSGMSYWQYNQKHKTKWNERAVAEKLIAAMKDEDYSADILMMLVRSVPAHFQTKTTTDQDVLEHVDAMFNAHSLFFREVYGVFGADLHVKT